MTCAILLTPVGGRSHGEEYANLGLFDRAAVMADSEHLADYLRRPVMPFFLWLRGIAGNKLLELHRRHLGTPMRDARREISLYRGPMPGASSAALAARLLGHDTRPSEA